MSPKVQNLDHLDAVDQTIVDVLVKDGRVSIPVLAEQVGISRATAYSRFDRLVDQGIITGFGARVDPGRVGLAVGAMVMLTVEQGDWPELRERVLATAGVQWIGLAAGTVDFIVLVRAGDLPELRDAVLKELLSIPGIRSAQTSVLLDEARPAGAIL